MNNPDKANLETETQDAEVTVQSLLESMINQQLTVPQLIEALKARRRRDADSTWQALALVDQYFRRGRISQPDFSEIKAGLNSLAFGVRTGTATSTPVEKIQSKLAEPVTEAKQGQPLREHTQSKDASLAQPQVEKAKQQGHSGANQPPRLSLQKKVLIVAAAMLLVAAMLINSSRRGDPAPPGTTAAPDLNAQHEAVTESNPSTQLDTQSTEVVASAHVTTTLPKPESIAAGPKAVHPNNAPPEPLDQGATDVDHTAAQSTAPTSRSDSIDDVPLNTSTPSEATAPTNEAQPIPEPSSVDNPVVVSYEQ